MVRTIKLREIPENNTVTFYLPRLLREKINFESYQKDLTISGYVHHCILILIGILHQNQKKFFIKKDTSMIMTSLSRLKMNDKIHPFIYKCVKEYKLFTSRSEMLRFSVLLCMLLEAIFKAEIKPFELKEEIQEDFIDDFPECDNPLEVLRRLYPNIPDYKFINEE